MAFLVLALAWFLAFDRTEWGLLLLAITSVLVAEMFNTALECLGRAVEPHPNPLLGKALDMASGAVLLAAVGASGVGLILFVPALWRWFG
jgi:diacylglycerol kinase (ATP)